MESPLAARHRALGAAWGRVAGREVPLHYGSPEEEARRARRGVAVADLSHRPKIEVTGPDAAEFLHNLLACDVKAVAPGAGCYGAFLSPQGKMVADLHLWRTDEGFLLDTEPEAAGLADRFRPFIMNSKVEVAPLLLGHLHLFGPRAVELLSRLGAGAPAKEHAHFPAAVAGAKARVVRISRYGVEGFDLLLSPAGLEGAWEGFRRAGAQPTGWAALEALRVEAGVPRFGAEMDSETFPQEARIEERAVSFTKGCYPGQETMARLKNRGRVNRLLAGLLLDGPAPAGAKLLLEGGHNQRPETLGGVSGGQEAGRVTTSCVSPALGRPAALAMVRAEVANAGTALRVEGGPAATVADLPLVPARAAVEPRNR